MSEKDPESVRDPGAQSKPGSAAGGRLLRRLAMLFVVLAVLGVAGGISAHWLTNRPQARRRPPQRQAMLVEVRRVQLQEENVVIQAMGTVVPAKSIELASRVSGEIVQVSPNLIPGGRFMANEFMAKVDPTDFELAVRLQQAQAKRASADVEQAASAITQREADLAKAESALTLEMGQQSAAEGEYKLLGKTVKPEDESLVLREPQLKQAKANCLAAKGAKRAAEAARDAAKAAETASEVALEQAQLDLKRTEIRAPFNTMVRSRNVDLGAQVAVGSSLASLVGTDEYWVEAAVRVDHLERIQIPGFNSEGGSAVRIYHERASDPETYSSGVVKRLMSEIEPQGRMARLLVSVEDPLELKAAPEHRRPLILGRYVRVEIVGQKLSQVVRVERTALRDGNKVWILGPDDTLEIRDVKISWAGNNHVYVAAGLGPDDQLIVSDLGAPVAGMALRTSESPGARAPQPSKARPGARRQEKQP